MKKGSECINVYNVGPFNCCTALLTNLIIEEFPHRRGLNVKTPHPLQQHGSRHLLYPKSSGFLPSLFSKKEAHISGSQSCHWLKNIYSVCVRACVCARRREGNRSCRKEKPKAKKQEKKRTPKIHQGFRLRLSSQCDLYHLITAGRMK